jgi:release factor glutamine methyltransferase
VTTGAGGAGAGEVLAGAARRLEAAGVPSPRWDAEVLLGWVLGCRRADLPLFMRRVIPAAQAVAFEAAVARRAGREPLQHIVGRQDFMGLELAVDRRALIPRPDTEILVEVAVQNLRWMGACGGDAVCGGDAAGGGAAARDSTAAPAWAADIGTGGGAIAIALAHYCPGLRVLATDVSPAALALAQANATRHGVGDRIRFALGDLLEPATTGSVEPAAGLTCVVSNPPYIASGEIARLEPEVALHEPKEALDGGPDGLVFYHRLIPATLPLLRPGGFCAVEVGAGQAAAVAALFRGAGYTGVTTTRDLAGIERVVLGRRGRHEHDG